MDDLIAFLRDRIAEDEAVARKAATLPHGGTEWHAGAEGSVFAPAPSQLHVRGAILSLDDIGTHIARWDPARVLAEVDAKREILDEYRLWAEDDSRDYDQSQTAADRTAALEVVVKLLAQPYAEHPDYRQEWRS